MAWTGRLLAEGKDYPFSRVVTLTYASEKDRFADLNYKHIQDFLKIHRNEASAETRYFVVGEYGEESGHAHWHMALFGERSWQPDWAKKAVYCDLRGWTDTHGFASCMRLVPETAAYISGYTLKKGENLTPFTRHSLKPSIGFTRIDGFAETVFKQHGQKVIPAPTWWAFNGKKYPLTDGAAKRFKTSYLKLGGMLRVESKWEKQLMKERYLMSDEYWSTKTMAMLQRDYDWRMNNGATVKDKETLARNGSVRI